MKKITTIVFTTLFFIGCKPVQDNMASEKAESVSLIAVIANPEKFHKKTIIVEGYFIMESEGDAIYVSKDDCTNALYKNAIFLFTNANDLKEMGIKKPYRGYIRLEGVFNKDIKGSYDFYSGTFEKVISVDRLVKRV